MPIVQLGEAGRWTNYHGTGVCEDVTRFALRSGDAQRGRDELAIAAGAVREWLARAGRAPRDPAWVADGVAFDEWDAVSPVTGALDAFAWGRPEGAATTPGPSIDLTALPRALPAGAPAGEPAGLPRAGETGGAPGGAARLPTPPVAPSVSERDRAADQQNECDHQPSPGGLACEQKGVMGTDHQQQHRQGQVIVVQRTLFGLLPEFGSWLPARFQISNYFFLVGDNNEEHVGRHDGADD